MLESREQLEGEAEKTQPSDQALLRVAMAIEYRSLRYEELLPLVTDTVIASAREALNDFAMRDHWPAYLELIAWYAPTDSNEKFILEFIQSSRSPNNLDKEAQFAVLQGKLAAISSLGFYSGEGAAFELERIAFGEPLTYDWCNSEVQNDLRTYFTGDPLDSFIRGAAFFGMAKSGNAGHARLLEDMYSQIVDRLQQRTRAYQNPNRQLSIMRENKNTDAVLYSVLVDVMVYKEVVAKVGGISAFVRCCSDSLQSVNYNISPLFNKYLIFR